MDKLRRAVRDSDVVKVRDDELWYFVEQVEHHAEIVLLHMRPLGSDSPTKVWNESAVTDIVVRKEEWDGAK